MKILHLDNNHPLLIEQLSALGYTNHEDYSGTKEAVQAKIHLYDGIVIRSRFRLDSTFLKKAVSLKFIARVGAGLENIDTKYAKDIGVALFSAPEGNSNAVGEHTLGMLLSLFNKLTISDHQVRNGIWQRESNRGNELYGKTIGIIGFGRIGQFTAKYALGNGMNVIAFDPFIENISISLDIANQKLDVPITMCSMDDLLSKSDFISLHVPMPKDGNALIGSDEFNKMKDGVRIVNAARGGVINEDACLLYTSPSPRDVEESRMPSSA